MLITIEGVGITQSAIYRQLGERNNPEAQLQLVDEGTKSNIAGDINTYLVYVLNILGDLSIGLISAFIYDLIKEQAVSVKINGKKVDDCTINEIRAFIQENSKSEDTDIN